MSERIQGRTGDSLAGIYDVVGGRANVNTLNSEDVSLVHEMGQVAFSERLRSAVRIVEALGVAQSAAFDVVIDDLPGGPFRIQCCSVVANAVNRISNITVSMEQGDGSRGIPLFAWSSGSGVALSTAKFHIGGALVSRVFLLPQFYTFPVLGLGEFQDTPGQQNRRIRIAGDTAAFGAGTVDIQALLLVTHTHIPGGAQQPRSYGLPIPSW